MNTIFIPKGRLGNALFRYFACSIFCIKYDAKYVINNQYNSIINDDSFIQWMEQDLNNINMQISNHNYLFDGFYQHDSIYIKYKTELLEYINKNDNHFVLTDGVEAGDGNYQQFYLKDIINTHLQFNKYYDTVLHIRLGDHVTHGWYIPFIALQKILDKINFTSNSCIVVNEIKNDIEQDYLNNVKCFIYEKYKINILVESNDVLTDFHIMKNAKILICSMSTISWCAAFLSSNIEKCYMPDYSNIIYPKSTCKHPIQNTELYSTI